VPLLPQAKLYSPDISRLTTSLRQTDRVPPRHNLPAPSLDRTLHLGLVSPNWSMADSIYIEFCAAHSSNCLPASFGYLHKSFPFPSQKVLLGSLCCSPKRHCITLQIFHRILIKAFSFTMHHNMSSVLSLNCHQLCLANAKASSDQSTRIALHLGEPRPYTSHILATLPEGTRPPHGSSFHPPCRVPNT
jgi:hypothetical protein